MTEKTFYPSILGTRQDYTNGSNMLGVPDATCAYKAVLAGQTKYEDVKTFLDNLGKTIAEAIPQGSTLQHAYIGIHGNYSIASASLAQNAKIQKVGSGGIWAATSPVGNYGCPALGVSNKEEEIDAFHFTFTMEDYRTENFSFWVEAVNGSTGLATFYCDAVWIRIVYTEPPTEAELIPVQVI